MLTTWDRRFILNSAVAALFPTFQMTYPQESVIKDALYYLALCSINCSHYTTFSTSTGSNHGTCLRCTYIGGFTIQMSTSCTAWAFCAAPPSQCLLHLTRAIISGGREAPSWDTVLFRFRKIPSSELKSGWPNCSNFPCFSSLALWMILLCLTTSKPAHTVLQGRTHLCAVPSIIRSQIQLLP